MKLFSDLRNWYRRMLVIRYARSQLGKSNPQPYWQLALAQDTNPNSYPKDWCGGFALWALKKAGLAKTWYWEIGKGFLYRLPQTTNPEPGDIAYFDRNQHQAIVKKVEGDRVILINGNSTGGIVKESAGPIADVRAFFSIKPLIG